MSVPKRFKTKVQLYNFTKTSKVSVKTNCVLLLDKYCIFAHPTKKKQINQHNLNFMIKK